MMSRKCFEPLLVATIRIKELRTEGRGIQVTGQVSRDFSGERGKISERKNSCRQHCAFSKRGMTMPNQRLSQRLIQGFLLLCSASFPSPHHTLTNEISKLGPRTISSGQLFVA